MCVKLSSGDLNSNPSPPHPTSIYTCRVWEVRAEVQVFRKEFHTHIHLDYVRVEILSCKKKKKKTIYSQFKKQIRKNGLTGTLY